MPSPYMARIGERDLPDRLYPAVPRWVTQCGVAVLCVGAAGLIRLGINILAPGAAVFALVFPAIMLATLFARWQSGLLTAVISVSYAFFFIYLPSPTTTESGPYRARLAIRRSAGVADRLPLEGKAR